MIQNLQGRQKCFLGRNQRSGTIQHSESIPLATGLRKDFKGMRRETEKPIMRQERNGDDESLNLRGEGAEVRFWIWQNMLLHQMCNMYRKKS